MDSLASDEAAPLIAFRRAHRGDRRASFRQDSGALRPWRDDAAHSRRLATLLLARMLDSPDVFGRPRIERFRPPALSFVLDRTPRTLHALVADAANATLYRSLRGRVSTYAYYGYALHPLHVELFRHCDHSAVRVLTDDVGSTVPWTVLAHGRFSDHAPGDTLTRRALRFFWIRASTNGTISLRLMLGAERDDGDGDWQGEIVPLRLLKRGPEQLSSAREALPARMADRLRLLRSGGRDRRRVGTRGGSA